MPEGRPDSTRLPSTLVRRLGGLGLLASCLLGARLVWLASHSVVARLADFGWFWLPLRVLRRIDSSLRMDLAWTLEPWPVDSIASWLGVVGRVTVAHLPILLALALLVTIPSRSRQAGSSRWVVPAILLFALPDALLTGHQVASNLGLARLARLAASMALAGALLIALVVLARRLAPGIERLGSWAWIVLLPVLLLPALVALGRGHTDPAEGNSTAEARRGRAPNVLLISIDSLRADHLSSYGYPRPTTPVIDRLAGEGARFEVALAPSPWTLPSHMTMLTGLSPWSHGVIDSDRVLSGRVETLAERFSAHGYDTFAVVSGRYLDASFGYARGFDSYDDYSMNLEFQHLLPAQRSVNASMLVRFRRILERRGPTSAPIFLFLHLFDVHFDYLPVEPFDALFVAPGASPSVDMIDFADNPDIHLGMADEDLDYVLSQYDGEIRATDALIGNLIGLLEERGGLDETIVLVTSDHGEEFFEHGRKGHRASLFEESLRVPLIVRYPPVIPAGTVVVDPVGLEDLGSTLLGLAGFREPLGRGSRDLSRRLRAGASTTGSPPEETVLFGSLHDQLFSARSSRFKLILDTRGETPHESLYDLTSDPGETTDVLGSHPGEAEWLRERLSDWLAAGGAADAEAGRRELPEEIRRDLEALGYLD